MNNLINFQMEYEKQKGDLRMWKWCCIASIVVNLILMLFIRTLVIK